MKVEVEVSREELENEDGRSVDGIRATCTRCGHCTESFGTSSASLRRCLAIMREECPEAANNFYFADSEDY